jgi:hypothetical protein
VGGFCSSKQAANHATGEIFAFCTLLRRCIIFNQIGPSITVRNPEFRLFKKGFKRLHPQRLTCPVHRVFPYADEWKAGLVVGILGTLAR